MRCRSCATELEFVPTPKGRRMPLELEPAVHGNVRVEDGLAITLSRDQLEQARAAGELLRVPHFAGCTEPDRYRQR